MIKITMYEGNWQVHIGDEIWEFPSLIEMKSTLEQILEIKDTYGRINGKNC